MPSWGGYFYAKAKRYCQKPYTWSTYRDGCRKDPGHAGRCAPGRRKR